MEKMKLVTEELDEGDGAGYAEGAQYGPSHPPSWFRVEWPRVGRRLKKLSGRQAAL